MTRAAESDNARTTASTLRCHELYLQGLSTPEIPDLLQATPPANRSAVLEDDVDVILVHATAEDAIEWCSNASLHPDLVYIDPPYASHRDYVFTQRHPEDGRRVSRVVFGDRWAGGMEAYVDMLRPVFEGVHALLQPEGSFLLHVDPRGAPYLSILCDQIFGMGERLPEKHAPGFRNELIWSYGLGGSSPTSWPRKHDNIYWYSKGSDWFFDPPMTPATSQRMRGQMKKQPDVLAVPTINNMAKDRTGYPTQKPIELLEMLVGAQTPQGGLVADFFSGSGTTALAAYRRGYRAIATDISADAIAVARARLLDAGARVAIFRPEDAPAVENTPDSSAIVFQMDGRIDENARFIVDGVEPATHQLLRDIDGNESIAALDAS